MDNTPGPLPPKRPRPALAPTGFLVFQSGPLKGTRRALGMPLTCIGRADCCDVRLEGEGVGPLHCAIAHGPGGFLVRDLGGEGGTRVNGQPVRGAALRDGDVLTVGPFELRVQLPRLVAAAPAARAAAAPAEAAHSGEAQRIQVAAVVAQQAALAEEERRLAERRANLEQQEAQLAAHLKEKHARLVELHAQVQAARAALKRDRDAYERHVGKVTGDLSAAERDLLERRQRADAERRRAVSLQRRLRERYRRCALDAQAALRRRERELADLARELEQGGERLHQERSALAQAGLRFNGEVELRRRQMAAEWERLRGEREALRAERSGGRADLEAWAAELGQREAELEEERRACHGEREQWQRARQGLEKEVAGLEARARNQRRKVAELQQDIRRLEGLARDLRPKAGAADAPAAPPAPAPEVWGQRLALLEELAGELGDQRLRLAEQWEHLARAREAWQGEHRAAAAELRVLAAGLHERGEAFLARERQLEEAAGELCRRHEELAHLRQHLVGWQARVRARELAWEAERERLLADLRGREALAERHLAGVAELRQRWGRRRRRELAQLQADRQACEKVRQQYLALREERRRLKRELEEERGRLAARAVALEEYRRQSLSLAADRAAAERRVERLRRRWLSENAAALRALAGEREALRQESARVEDRHGEVRKLADALDAERAALAEKQAAWEDRLAQLEAEQAGLRAQLEGLGAQRDGFRREAEDLRGEVEQIARQLLEEPEAPPAVPLLERAA